MNKDSTDHETRRAARIVSIDTVLALGFDERFVRTWEYYLGLSEAGFATGVTQDLQIVFEKRRGAPYRVTEPAAGV